MKSKITQRLKIKKTDILKWIGTILTLALFLFLAQKQDWQTIGKSLKEVPLSTIIIVWVLFCLRIVINSFRWFVLLKIAEIKIPPIETVKIFFLGMFVSNFLPSTIGGDGIRFLTLLKYEDDKSIALSSIIIDRLVNVIAMILLLPISAAILFGNLSLVVEGAKGLFSGFFLGWRDKRSSYIESTKKWLGKFRFWIEKPKEFSLSFIITWSAQILYFFGIWMIARGLGMEITYLQVTGISVLTYLITLIPISINGYGVREVAITSLYSLLGYSIEAAISLAIISRLLYLSTTLIGAIWLPENISFIGEKAIDFKSIILEK
jgi:uncharacterized membrane protein YbhN (UPF0104 family)